MMTSCNEEIHIYFFLDCNVESIIVCDKVIILHLVMNFNNILMNVVY